MFSRKVKLLRIEYVVLNFQIKYNFQHCNNLSSDMWNVSKKNRFFSSSEYCKL